MTPGLSYSAGPSEPPVPTGTIGDWLDRAAARCGTSGAPKGATLSHRNLLRNAMSTAAGARLGPEDKLCIPVPLYHCFGMVLGVLACLASGAALAFPGQSFDAGTTLKCVVDVRWTALHGVPTMVLAMLDHAEFDHFDLSTLRTGVAAGVPCPPAMMRRMIDANGALASLGMPGEYCARGPGVMLGYWEQPEATAAAIRHGWMHSGDLATMDELGRIRIVGRIKDMIICGGENICPDEIEAFLLGHPDIADVAVFGLPGDRLCAWIHPRGTLEPEEVTLWCTGRIAHHNVLALIRIVEALPMTVTGKVQKFAMRDAEAASAA